MARHYQRLDVFNMADALVLDIYRHTASYPDDERFGLARQIRRAAISTPANIVEGAERPTEREFLRYLDIASGSAAEVRYLLSVSRRLAFSEERESAILEARYDEVVRALQNLRAALRREPVE